MNRVIPMCRAVNLSCSLIPGKSTLQRAAKSSGKPLYVIFTIPSKSPAIRRMHMSTIHRIVRADFCGVFRAVMPIRQTRMRCPPISMLRFGAHQRHTKSDHIDARQRTALLRRPPANRRKKSALFGKNIYQVVVGYLTNAQQSPGIIKLVMPPFSLFGTGAL